MGLNQYDKLWWIALGFGGFGFFGYAFFPLILELAVEETFPIGKYNTKVSVLQRAAVRLKGCI